MKSKLLQLFLIIAIFLIGSLSIKAQTNNDVLGNWNFKAPYGGSGYTSGILEIKKDSVIMTFTGMGYKYPSSSFKSEDGTLTYNIYVEGTEVFCTLKIENETKITGNAIWDSGETPLILTKKIEP